jgi:hypothetical protein
VDAHRAAEDLRRIAADRFAEHGPHDARGAAIWDVAGWLEDRERDSPTVVHAGASSRRRRAVPDGASDPGDRVLRVLTWVLAACAVAWTALVVFVVVAR